MVEQIPGTEMTEAERRRLQVIVMKADKLDEQCKRCKLGDVKIGPKSGCEIRKKLVIDRSEVAWKHEHLFFDNKRRCKMFKENKLIQMEVPEEKDQMQLC